jgi:acetolactate synthase-1/2/3 large subunit
MPAVRDIIVHRLREIGVRALFGIPGGGANLDLIDAAGRANLPFVLTATETAGALAAIAQADVTARPGACLTTLGPGVASVANGVACAYLDRAPILVFTDSHASASAGRFEHQQIDQQAFLRPSTKWSGRLTPGCALATFEQAIEQLLALPPGPVHLDCPEDFESARGPSEAAERSPAQPDRRARARGGGAPRALIKADAPPPRSGRTHPSAQHPAPSARRLAPSAHALLSRSRRPLAIVGLAARRREDATAIRDFLERRGVPAMVTYKAKGVVPDDHRCFAGIFTNARIEQTLVSSSDLIIGIGLDPVELLPRPWPYTQPVVYTGPWSVRDSHVPFAVQHVTDISSGMRGIDSALAASDWDLDDVHRQVEQQRGQIAVRRGANLTPDQVVRAAAERFARNARVTVDAGAHMFPATMLWPVSEPNQMLISNGLSTMGFALPAAIGAAFADRERPVVALTGDGGLLICAAELLTAVREKLRIIVIVFSDASLSLIDIKQQRRRYKPAGVALGSVKWAALADSFGAAAFVASTEAQLASALEQAMTCTGPALIEAKIDASGYTRMLEVVRG